MVDVRIDNDLFATTPRQPKLSRATRLDVARVHRPDARWVLQDITLDGNTFRDSHSVDKKAFVGEAAVGVAMTCDRWEFAFARYYRSREFDGQRSRPSFGSFTISRAF